MLRSCSTQKVFEGREGGWWPFKMQDFDTIDQRYRKQIHSGKFSKVQGSVKRLK